MNVDRECAIKSIDPSRPTTPGLKPDTHTTWPLQLICWTHVRRDVSFDRDADETRSWERVKCGYRRLWCCWCSVYVNLNELVEPTNVFICDTNWWQQWHCKLFYQIPVYIYLWHHTVNTIIFYHFHDTCLRSSLPRPFSLPGHFGRPLPFNLTLDIKLHSLLLWKSCIIWICRARVSPYNFC